MPSICKTRAYQRTKVIVICKYDTVRSQLLSRGRAHQQIKSDLLYLSAPESAQTWQVQSMSAGQGQTG